MNILDPKRKVSRPIVLCCTLLRSSANTKWVFQVLLSPCRRYIVAMREREREEWWLMRSFPHHFFPIRFSGRRNEVHFVAACVSDPHRDAPRPRPYQRCPGGVLWLPHCQTHARWPASARSAVRPALSHSPAAFDWQQCRQFCLQLQWDVPVWVDIHLCVNAKEVTTVNIRIAS